MHSSHGAKSDRSKSRTSPNALNKSCFNYNLFEHSMQRHRFTAGSPGEKKAFKSCGPMGTDGHRWVPGDPSTNPNCPHVDDEWH